jgi:parvulin-like peptidyl-prolyl isomerase
MTIFAKKRLFFILMIGCALALAAQQVVEEIVAVVNDDVISLSDFMKEYESRVQTARLQLKGEQLDATIEQIKAGLLDAMITDLLLLQLAKEKNINVTEQLKMAMENVRKENNLESDEELKRAVRSQGYDYDAWLKQMEETILRQSVVYSEINKSIALDEAEVIDYHKKHQTEFVVPAEFTVRAVYLALEGRTPAELDARKAEISAKIRDGLDFAKAAEEFCDAPLKETKGDLGTLKKGETDKAIADALEPLGKGGLSPWILTKNGSYLLKVEDKKDSRTLSFEEAKRSIEERMMQERQSVKMVEFLKVIKMRSFIKILKPNPAADKS